MSELLTCQEKLIKEAERKGYLTFDDIMDMADTYNLSVSEVDKLSEYIQMRGIIVYEDAPETKAFEETLEDYSRVDYDAIFNEIITSSPDLEKIVNEVKKLPPPQYGEVQTLSMQAANQNSCYEMTFFNRKSQRTFTCQIVQNTKRHLKRAKTMQISGIGHSVIRGLVTTGQWFSASTTVYPRGSPQGRRHSYFVDC